MGELRLELLGPPVARVDSEPLRVDTRKALAVLAVLAIDGPQPRAALAALLWPDSETSRARGALRRTLSVLSRGLSDRWVVSKGDRVALEGPGLTCDVTEVDRLLAAVHEHGDPPDERCPSCLQNLAEVARLHRGDLLEGFGLRDSPEFEDWCAEHAESRRRRLCRSLDLWTRASLGARDLDTTVAGLEQWLAVDPLNEQVHTRLMLVHAWRGERSEAIRRYRQCVATLEAELGVAPLPRTTNLYRAILEDRVPVMAATPTLPAPGTDGAPTSVDDPVTWPLVGREAELHQLDAAFGTAGQGGLIVVRGEAGIGKTRLVEVWRQRLAERGVRAAVARGHPGETELAFGPVADLLRHATTADDPISALANLPDRTVAEARRLAPALLAQRGPVADPPALDSPGARAVLFEAVWDTLEAALAADVQGLVVIDDLQSADPSTLELIGYGLRRLTARRLTVLLCLRPEEMPPAVGDLLSEPSVATAATTLELGRLAGEATADLVRAVLPNGDRGEVAARLHEEAEGLPLFIVEYLRLIVDGEVNPEEPHWVLPHGAQDLVRSRLAGLSDHAQQLASTAAAIGRSFDLDVLLQASGRSEDEVVDGVEDMLAHRLVREVAAAGQTPRFDFVHDKLRAAIYENLTTARRRLLHGRIADVLTAGARRGRAAAAVIAEHALRAGRDDVAAQWFVKAGTHAQSLFANREALDHYERAIGLGLPLSWNLRTTIADLQTLLGDYGSAIATLEAAAAQTDDPLQLAITEQRLGAVHLRRGATAVAAAHLERAVVLMPEESLAARSRVAADLGLLRLRTDDLTAASQLAADAWELAVSGGDVEAQAQARNLQGVIDRHRGLPEAACRHLEEAVTLAASLPDPAAHVGALNNLALALADAGDVGRAIEVQTLAVERGAQRGDRHREAALRNNLADLLHRAGREQDAMTALQIAVALFAGVDQDAPPSPEIWQLVDW